jgi:hypothetical protein
VGRCDKSTNASAAALLATPEAIMGQLPAVFGTVTSACTVDDELGIELHFRTTSNTWQELPAVFANSNCHKRMFGESGAWG